MPGCGARSPRPAAAARARSRARGGGERGRVAAGAPEGRGSARGYPNHAVVATGVDGTVVDEKEIGYLAELHKRLVVAVGDRLVRVVAAGHYERDARIPQQQVVQRRVREHHPERRLARGDLVDDPTLFATPQEDYGAGRGSEEGLFLMGYVAEFPHLHEVAGHEREGFVLAHLAAPQGPDRSGVERVAGQMVATEALDGDDGACARSLGTAR